MKNFYSALFFIALSGVSSCLAKEGQQGYLVDERGAVVRNSFGECWRTGYWTPDMASAECDPDLVKKAEVKKVEKAQPVPAAISIAKPAAEPKTLIQLSAETLFDFDRAEVKEEGQKMLDEKIVLRLRPEMSLLTITGHADRIGTEAYNQNLSERRAYAVRLYLEKKGISAERMSAIGKGESQPDPAANTVSLCKGKQGSALIACLQPDRRVTVETR